MRKRFGVFGKALGWVEEYMRDKSQAVRVNSNEPANTVLKFGGFSRISPRPENFYQLRRRRQRDLQPT